MSGCGGGGERRKYQGIRRQFYDENITKYEGILAIFASERRVVATEVKFGNCPSVRASVRASVRPVKFMLTNLQLFFKNALQSTIWVVLDRIWIEFIEILRPV